MMQDFFTKLYELHLEEEQRYILAETYFRIMGKINSVNYRNERFLYLLVEEICLMFDVLVVRIERNESLGEKGIFESTFNASDMNILQEDYNEIQKAFSIDLGKKECLENKKIVSYSVYTPIEPKNNTIKFIDSLIIFPFPSESKDKQPICTIEIYYSKGNEDVPNRHPYLSILLEQIRKSKASLFVEGLLLLLLDALMLAQKRGLEKEDDFKQYPEVRKGKREFLAKAPSKPKDFVNVYKKHFASLDRVFKSLREKFRLPFLFYFSYRFPKDKDLSFFFTAKDVSYLFDKRGFDIAKFQHLWMYPYQKGGLNGYILKTAHPIYVSRQDNDKRWTSFAEEPIKQDEDIIYNAKLQKDLLLEMFALSESDNLYTYIVPILIFHNTEEGNADLLVAMHYTTNKPISNDLRKRMFDLAWESSATVELALIGQKVGEERETLSELLAAGVGHDLQSPLQALKDNVAFLKKQIYQKTSDIEESLEDMEREVYFAIKIARDVLDFHALEDLMEKLIIKDVAINQIFKDAVTHIDIAKDIMIVNNIDPMLRVPLDAERMTRVFFNLIKNASESFEGMRQGEKVIKAVSAKFYDNVHIEISDTGKGILRQDIEKIFLPYFSTKGGRGAGIGLPIAKAIIIAHGGSITVESKIRGGSTFTITLPKKLERRESSDSSPKSISSR